MAQVKAAAQVVAFTLELSRAEAMALVDVLSRVSGPDIPGNPRHALADIKSALEQADSTLDRGWQARKADIEGGVQFLRGPDARD